MVKNSQSKASFKTVHPSTKNYCFTLHDFTVEHQDHLKGLPLRYLIWGEEKCPDTGRPHLQGMESLL